MSNGVAPISAAATVQEASQGASLYLDHVNAKGGVGGQKIELLTLDDKFDTKLTLDNARVLIEQKGVLGLFMTRGTPHTQGILPLLEQHGVPFHVMATGFTWETQDREADTQAAQSVWQEAKQLLANPDVDLVLLDELTYMVAYGYITLDEVLSALTHRPPHQHVIITGRGCHRSLLELADTVSEVKNVKHAFDAGIKAQKGIDW